jgi:hypothetical protein
MKFAEDSLWLSIPALFIPALFTPA